MHAHHLGPSQARQPAGLRAPGGRNATVRVVGTGGGQATAVLKLQRLAGNAAVTRLIASRQRDLVQAALRSPGRPLGEQVRADMEARFGAGLADVRVHTGPAADRAARVVSAEAFTTGSRLVFRQGRYAPSSAVGRRVLAHELAHVLQQRRGPVAGTPGPLRISDPADRFEREADATARQVTDHPQVAGSLGLGDRPAMSRPPAGLTDVPVQRHWTGKTHDHYDALTNGCGTHMRAELHPGSLGKGSAPSKKPPWWPGPSAPSAGWFSKYMVQGHLLNNNLGGPGNTMSNLTPITQSTNRQHEKKAESEVKDLVLKKNKIVNYEVWADYSKHPTAAALAQNTGATKAEIADIANYSQNMAHQLWCEWEEVDSKGKTVGTPPLAQVIWNEGV